MAKLTPMMQQYMDLKEEYTDSILMFRLGDFYEMFFEDAKIVARELELVLTGRDCGLEERAPMCGVPHHAVDTYVGRLIEKGYKVAICDQLEDPSTVKGIVKRGVTRVITPGTVVDNSMLDEAENNYILSVSYNGDLAGICYCDVSTGEFLISDELDMQKLQNELTRIAPKEVIAADSFMKRTLQLLDKLGMKHAYVTPYFDWAYEYKTAVDTLQKHFKVTSLSAFGCDDMQVALCAAGALMQYLQQTQKNALLHINRIVPLVETQYMILDSTTCRNLELTQTLMSGSKKGSLLWLLDKTKTAPGARLLKKYVLQPLKSVDAITARLDAVQEIYDDMHLKGSLIEYLGEIYDLERIISRISYGTINARDCISLKNSLRVLPAVKSLLSDTSASLLKEINDDIDPLEDLYELLERAIDEDAPISITDGNIIKKGFHPEVDTLINTAENGQNWLMELETREKEETGIKNLKVRFNKVFGYYIEVTKSYLNIVPYRYMRKQTLANCERYITEELKEMEDSILGAEEKRNRLEYDIFLQLRETLAENISRVQSCASAIAALDVLQSFSRVASENNYIRPVIVDNGTIKLKDSRHPVVEKMMKDMFVPNDVALNQKDRNLLLITGPNMAGKSTYMRQIGLIVLMAHIGCFVPAKSAKVCLVDRIFTRVGASDDLAAGQSTFMVEMNELANILHNATSKSLLILDEIGRGTSTIDGLSIAWASAEYIANRIKAKTLFATHYHELVELEHTFKGVKNCSVAVKEIGHEIVFLHKIVDGGTDKSFGIEVARLAGLPKEVIEKAKERMQTLQNLEYSLVENNIVDSTAADHNEKNTLPNSVRSLMKLNVDTLTPIEALNLVYNLKSELEGEGRQ
ncbi:DNA mismatch repair protein MutS [Christensenellaceae bacterium OttesenSCG-928-K19]|nr:DNA mismatch repair protein MutS [Christensenellaceae bacterium OttesenSCG-928-K19]